MSKIMPIRPKNENIWFYHGIYTQVFYDLNLWPNYVGKIQALLGQKDRKYTGMIWINDVKQTDWTLKAPAKRGPNSAVYNILVSPFYSQFTIEDL